MATRSEVFLSILSIGSSLIQRERASERERERNGVDIGWFKTGVRKAVRQKREELEERDFFFL
jgi:hypothetical protein